MVFKLRKCSFTLALLGYYFFLLLCVISHKKTSIEEFPDGFYLSNLFYDDFLLRRSGGKNIFFIDPYPGIQGIVDDQRIACSIESAGTFYFPNCKAFKIFLIFSSHESRLQNLLNFHLINSLLLSL